jgi:aminopeptidase
LKTFINFPFIAKYNYGVKIMVDPRVKKLADILANYSVKIKKGDIIDLNAGVEAQDLVLEICKIILKKGATPKLNVQMPGFAYTFFKYAPKNVLEQYPKIAEFNAKNTAGSIGIGTEYNTKELTHIDAKKLAARRKITHPISEIHLKKNNWVICQYPTHSLAQDAEMSLEEYENFVYKATNLDWAKESKKQDKLKRIVDKGNRVRIKGKDTDISFSIKGRQGIKCDGHRNMPDGEVFVAPVETDIEGHIAYSYPGIRFGKEVSGIRLWFKKGKVVKFKADKNEDMLRAAINTDAGSKSLGEFGIGTNFGIKKFSKQILFDEKIGGTIHLALGMAYKEGGGKNSSAIHWDMIKDLRDGGEFWIDDKLIQKNGKFTFKL